MATFINLQSGQQLDTCGFFAYISSINWCNCANDEVWSGLNMVKNGQGWFNYFQSNTPTCANQAPTCMPPALNQADQVGETLTVQSYGAIGIPTPSKTYQWQQSTDGVTFTDIVGQTGLNLAIISAYLGKHIRVKGTATNGIGTPAVCYSTSRVILPANASPVNLTAPIIAGATTQGSLLTCIPGTWSGYPAPSLSYQWTRNGLPINGATSNTYTLKLSDSLAVIACVVTANNGINPSIWAISNTITAGDYAPSNTVAPSISGSTTLGSQLTCNPGTWVGTNITLAYQWLSNGNPVGDNNSQYQLQITDSNAVMQCIVIATNPAGTSSINSNTITADDYAPVNVVPPVISVQGGGTPAVGSVLEATLGTWQGVNISYSYQWYRGATPVGTNSATYTVVTGDIGGSMTCEVTATNLGGTASATSNNINIPSGPGVTAPSNDTPPTIAVAGGGSALAGKVLACYVGTWNGTSPITYTFQWYSNASPVGTDAYYLMQVSDIGNNITCKVTATNAYGVDFETTNAILVTGNSATAPTNVVVPSLLVAGGGAPVIGSTLSVEVGVWNGTSPIVYTYEWFSGVTVVGTNSSYIIQPSDFGNAIKCKVTATNAYGNSTQSSNTLTAVAVPKIVAAPTLSGTPTIGQTLSTSDGTWSGNTPITYSYQWYRGLTPIGTNSPSYTLVTADLGEDIYCEVQALNAYGSNIASSNILVGQAVPSNITAPSILGSNIVGAVLSINTGSWSAYPVITSYQYLWQWSSDNGSTWNNYSPSQTNATKSVITADIGRLIRCLVTAVNAVGSSAQIDTNSLLIDSAPLNTVAPVISGTTLVGSILTTTNGTWTGSGTITYSYRWLRNGVAISGATNSTYTTVSADAGANITCEVTATNNIGPSRITGNAIIPTIAPSLAAGPIIYGSYSVGSTLTVEKGDYTAYPAVSLTYQWQTSTNGGTSWSNIVGQTGTSYVIQSGDAGNMIRVVETSTNGIGSPLVTNSNSATIITVVVQRPDNTVAPVVSGTPSIGSTLTTTNGTWANSPTSFAYQWLRAGSAISGAITNSYTLVSADVDQLITCRVTATNSGGSEIAVSNETYAFDSNFWAVITFATAQGFGLPTESQRRWMSQFVTELKANSLWSIYDRFWLVLNNGSEGFGRINWMNPQTTTYLLPLGTPAPTWSNTLGYTGDGVNGYLDTQYNPQIHGVLYTQNNAGRYAFVTARAAEGTTYALDGNSTLSNNNMSIAVTSTSNRINQSTSNGISTNARTIGFHAITRTGATTSQRMNDIIQAQNITSAAPSSLNQWIMRSASQYGAISIGWYALGAGVSDANALTLRRIVVKYLNNMF